jgi:hypothetical protein
MSPKSATSGRHGKVQKIKKKEERKLKNEKRYHKKRKILNNIVHFFKCIFLSFVQH